MALLGIGVGFGNLGEYKTAQKFLQKAVELMPRDPIVNDHYADILWKLNKNSDIIIYYLS